MFCFLGFGGVLGFLFVDIEFIYFRVFWKCFFLVDVWYVLVEGGEGDRCKL